MNKWVTIRDVAREAGVSIATVSRVLNSTATVSPERTRRVRDAVARLGYSPNPSALSLLRRETGGIGLLVPTLSEDYFAEFLRGVDRASQQSGYFLLTSSSHLNAGEFERALSSMHGRVDGLLLVAPDQIDYDANHSALRALPTVLVNSTVSDDEDGISVDNAGGLRAVTEHLLGKGHRRLALILGPDGANDATERQAGFWSAIRAHPLPSEYVLEVSGKFSYESGYEAANQILESGHQPTAIVATNDTSALGALRALLERGVRVPEDVALTGFDDIAAAQYATPGLTTVSVSIAGLGEAAVRKLITRLRSNGATPRQHDRVPVELVLRASTGD